MRQLHPQAWNVRNRPTLHSVPGFHAPRGNDKIRKVDLVLDKGRPAHAGKCQSGASGPSTKGTFHGDFKTYNALESKGVSFNYSFITNEFDAARLKAACERRRQNALLFTHVRPHQPGPGCWPPTATPMANPSTPYGALPPISWTPSGLAGNSGGFVNYLRARSQRGQPVADVTPLLRPVVCRGCSGRDGLPALSHFLSTSCKITLSRSVLRVFARASSVRKG